MQSVQKIEQNIFKRKKEFPNYFAENLDLKDETSCNARIVLISTSIEHIINHLTIPHIVNDCITRQDFFQHLNGYIKSVPELTNVAIELSIGGGVVRSLIAYLYKYVYHQKLKNNLPIEVILNKLLTKAGQLIQHPIVLGVGSDFDIYYHLDSSSNEIATKLQQSLKDYINAIETKFNLLGYNHPLKKSFLPIADIKPYQGQIDLIISQGGSDCDWLAFKITPSSSQNKFIMPNQCSNILFDLLLKGEYSYNKAKDGVIIEQKQAIRACRALLELPFTKLKASSLLMQELQNIKSTEGLDFKSKDQIDKLVRNSHFGGANNRVYRAKPNSPLSVLAKLSNEHHVANKQYLVPHFLAGYRNKPLETKEFTLQIKKYLIDVNQFIEQYTDNRILYHGTSVDSLLSIIRSGFWTSDNIIGQGNSACGPGVYCTGKIDIAKSYAKDNSASIVNITPSKHYPVRILNWQNMAKELQSQLQEQSLSLDYTHVFYLLREKYNIDIIINNAVIIQNLHAIKVAKNTAELIDSRMLYLQNRLEQETLDHTDLNNLFTEIKALSDLSLAIEHYKPKSWNEVISLCAKNIDASILDFQQQIKLIGLRVVDFYDQSKIESNNHERLNILLEKMLPLCEVAAKLGCSIQFSIENLIDQNIDLFVVNEDYSCLDYPEIIHKNWKVVSNVIYSKQDIDINHEKIKHAFIFSLKYGCKNIIANFLALGMDINIKDDEGNSFAHRLAAIRNVNAILFFTKLGVNFNVKNAAGQTPLHLAATFNRTDIIETLLSCGVNINEQDNNGDTCAHIATKDDFRENDKEKANFVAALIKAGADFTIKNNLNEIPLLLAAGCGTFGNAGLVLRTIISNVEQTGISNGHIDEIIRIIEKSIRFPEYFFEFLVGKINFNQISETGKLLSNVIVKIGNVEIVRKLIGKVDFNLPACNGYTPILIATAMGYAEIVELLIQQGVNLNHHFICANNNFITLREECANLIQDLLYKEKPIYEEMFMWKNNKTTSFKSFNKKYGTSAAERMNKLLTYKVRLFEDHNQPIAINVGDVAYILGYEKILELLGNSGLNINIFSTLNDQTICFAYDNYVQDYVSAESSDDPVKTLLNVFDDILKESPLPIEEELEEENNTWLDFYEDEEQEIHSKFYKFC